MRKKIAGVIAVIIVAVFVAGSAFGEMGNPVEGRNGRHQKKAEIARKLGLTPEQDRILNEAREAHRKDMSDLRSLLKEKRQALKSELAKPGVTRQQVEPIVAQVKKLQSDMVDHRIEGIFKVKSILTPEQFDKLQEMKGQKGKGSHMKKHAKKRCLS